MLLHAGLLKISFMILFEEVCPDTVSCDLLKIWKKKNSVRAVSCESSPALFNPSLIHCRQLMCCSMTAVTYSSDEVKLKRTFLNFLGVWKVWCNFAQAEQTEEV